MKSEGNRKVSEKKIAGETKYQKGLNVFPPAALKQTKQKNEACAAKKNTPIQNSPAAQK